MPRTTSGQVFLVVVVVVLLVVLVAYTLGQQDLQVFTDDLAERLY